MATMTMLMLTITSRVTRTNSALPMLKRLPPEASANTLDAFAGIINDDHLYSLTRVAVVGIIICIICTIICWHNLDEELQHGRSLQMFCLSWFCVFSGLPALYDSPVICTKYLYFDTNSKSMFKTFKCLVCKIHKYKYQKTKKHFQGWLSITRCLSHPFQALHPPPISRALQVRNVYFFNKNDTFPIIFKPIAPLVILSIGWKLSFRRLVVPSSSLSLPSSPLLRFHHIIVIITSSHITILNEDSSSYRHIADDYCSMCFLLHGKLSGTPTLGCQLLPWSLPPTPAPAPLPQDHQAGCQQARQAPQAGCRQVHSRTNPPPSWLA